MSWHTLMWFFGGLCMILFLFALAKLTNLSHLSNPQLDSISVALIGLALVGLLYGCSTIFSANIVTAIVAVIVGAMLMVIFVKRQANIAEPLINLQPLTVRAFAIGVVINMLSLIVIFAMNIVTPMFVQAIGATAMSASFILFPAILLSCVIAPIAGKFYDAHGARHLLPIGFILIAVFCILLAVTRNSGNFILMAVLYVPVICGSALIVGPVQSFALSKLSYKMNPYGVTVMSTGFQIAGCIGSSIFTGIYGLVLGKTIVASSEMEASAHAFGTVSFTAAAVAIIGFCLSLAVAEFEAEKKAHH